MSISNTSQSYGSVSKVFHWSIAALIITLIPLGLIANWLPYDTSGALARKAFLFSLHKTLGVTVFFLALGRIAWTFTQPKPASLNPDRKLEHFAAETVHWLLYGALVMVPLTGWIHHAATTGFAPIWLPLGQSLPFVPKNEVVASVFAALHFFANVVLVGSLGLHIAGALKHHVIDKDATLRRMWFGTSDMQDLPPHHSERRPAFAAALVWGLALSVGSYVGLTSTHSQDAAHTKLATVASDWQVESGDISIAIKQFGSTVEGRFQDWTAAISFDPDVALGQAGTVEATISIASLTLGSVTQQALGPDYFASATFPTAQFSADLIAGETGYEAVGALQIRDQSVPVRFPFDLTLNEKTAQMVGTLTLNRLDFGVGASMTDESSLAYRVDVSLAVTATLAEQ